MNTNDLSICWWRKRKTIINGLIASAVILGGILFMPLSEAANPVYQVQQVSRGNFLVKVSANGLLRGKVYNLAFENVSGNINEIDVTQGQAVTAGQVLARLDARPLLDAVRLAQVSVNAAKANLRAALEHKQNVDQEIDAQIDAANAVVQATQNDQNAIHQQSDVNIIAAEKTLQIDRQIRNSVDNTADALVQQAELQRQQSLNTCQTTFASSSMPNQGSTLQTCQDLANATFNLAVASASTSVTTAQGQVKKDEEALDQALANATVNNTVVNGELRVAKKLVTVAQDNADRTSAEKDVIADRGALAIAFTELDIARHNLANVVLVAPHNGVVTAINGTVAGPPGIPVDLANGAAGSGPGGIFIQIVDPSCVQQLLLNVDEADISKIAVGDQVQFTLRAFGKHQFTGTVQAISPNGVSGPTSTQYPVIVTIDPASIQGLNLLPNMTASAQITAVHDPAAIRLPIGAINFADSAMNAGGTSKGVSLVSEREASDAMKQAQQMQTQLIAHDPKLANIGPIPAFVIVQSGAKKTFVAKPVVVGLSDGVYYQVMQGLSGGENIIVASDVAENPTPTTSSPVSGGSPMPTIP